MTGSLRTIVPAKHGEESPPPSYSVSDNNRSIYMQRAKTESGNTNDVGIVPPRTSRAKGIPKTTAELTERAKNRRNHCSKNTTILSPYVLDLYDFFDQIQSGGPEKSCERHDEKKGRTASEMDAHLE